MATATSRKAAPDQKVQAKRRATAKKLLDLHVGLGNEFRQMAELEAELKQFATDAGESFREQFGADYVSASGAVPAEFKGNVPVIQTEVWLALEPKLKKDLEKRGIVKVEPQYGRATSGRVTVKVH